MGHGCAPSLSRQSASFYRIPPGTTESIRPLKLLEPNRQPVPFRPVLDPVRPIDQRSGNSLQPEFQKRAVMDFEQPVGDVNSVIRVDANQVNEGRMMELRQILAARLHR
jgi:hypothetical protein